MKGEYGAHNITEMPPDLFPSKLNLHHPFYLSSPSKNPSSAATPADSIGASIEVVRRPRGRPRGSKNKPKPPVTVSEASDNTSIMSPFILEISSGTDVVAAVRGFCLRKGMGVCVLSGFGAVSNVTLWQPSQAATSSTVTFHGSFEVLSVSATFLPPSPPRAAAVGPPPVSNLLSVSLAGPRGQIVGGFVAGPLLATGTMYVMAASFNNPAYHQLPVDNEETINSVRNNDGEGQTPAVVSSSGGDNGNVGAGELCAASSMLMYGCQMDGGRSGGSDVIWSPVARAQPPPY